MTQLICQHRQQFLLEQGYRRKISVVPVVASFVTWIALQSMGWHRGAKWTAGSVAGVALAGVAASSLLRMNRPVDGSGMPGGGIKTAVTGQRLDANNSEAIGQAFEEVRLARQERLLFPWQLSLAMGIVLLALSKALLPVNKALQLQRGCAFASVWCLTFAALNRMACPSEQKLKRALSAYYQTPFDKWVSQLCDACENPDAREAVLVEISKEGRWFNQRHQAELVRKGWPVVLTEEYSHYDDLGLFKPKSNPVRVTGELIRTARWLNKDVSLKYCAESDVQQLLNLVDSPTGKLVAANWGDLVAKFSHLDASSFKEADEVLLFYQHTEAFLFPASILNQRPKDLVVDRLSLNTLRRFSSLLEDVTQVHLQGEYGAYEVTFDWVDALPPQLAELTTEDGGELKASELGYATFQKARTAIATNWEFGERPSLDANLFAFLPDNLTGLTVDTLIYYDQPSVKQRASLDRVRLTGAITAEVMAKLRSRIGTLQLDELGSLTWQDLTGCETKPEIREDWQRAYVELASRAKRRFIVPKEILDTMPPSFKGKTVLIGWDSVGQAEPKVVPKPAYSDSWSISNPSVEEVEVYKQWPGLLAFTEIDTEQFTLSNIAALVGVEGESITYEHVPLKEVKRALQAFAASSQCQGPKGIKVKLSAYGGSMSPTVKNPDAIFCVIGIETPGTLGLIGGYK